MTRVRMIKFCLAVAVAGVSAAAVRVLMLPSAALPRWDLLACLGLTVIGIAGGLACLSRGPFPHSDGAQTSRHWWPDRNGAWIAAGLCAGVLPVGLLFYAAVSFSPEAGRIADAGGAIRAVPVQKVVSSEYVRKKNSRHYAVVAQVSVPFDSGRKQERAAFNSDSRVERGDSVWALFSPSSARLGVLVESDREVLEEKRGGSAQWGIQVFALAYAIFCLLVGIAFGGVAKASRGMRRPLKKGQCRSLAVTVTGVGVGVDRIPSQGGTVGQPKPRVEIEGDAGGRLEVLLDPVVDPVHLSQEINGRRATLYWAHFAVDRPGPKRVRAMLVLDGQRCVRGVLRVGDVAEGPEGRQVPVSKALPEGDDLRAIRPLPAWDPRFHAPALWSLLVGVLALSGIAFGAGRVAALLLCAVACLALAVSRVWGKSRRKRYLQGLLPNPGASDIG